MRLLLENNNDSESEWSIPSKINVNEKDIDSSIKSNNSVNKTKKKKM
jgi:hypothetical protein